MSQMLDALLKAKLITEEEVKKIKEKKLEEAVNESFKTRKSDDSNTKFHRDGKKR